MKIDKGLVVPPSSSLIMPREDVCKSSLVPPSGALLAWLEMEDEEHMRKDKNG